MQPDSANILYNSKKKKYAKLNELVEIEEFVDRTVNIIFDSHFLFDYFKIDYYKKLTSSIIDERMFNVMTAEFFNLVGHYKNYFNQKVGCPVRFFLIHGHQDAYKSLLYPEWNSQFINKQTHPLGIKFVDKVVKRCANYSTVFQDIHVLYAENANIDRLTLPLILNAQNKVFVNRSPINLFFTSDSSALMYANILPNCKFIIGDRLYTKGNIGKFLGKEYSTIKHIRANCLLPIHAYRGNYAVPLLHPEIKQRAILNLFEQDLKDEPLIQNGEHANVELLTSIINKRQQKCKTQIDVDVLRTEIEKRIDFFDLQLNANNLVINEADRIDILEKFNANVEDEDIAFDMNNKYFNNTVNLSVLI